MITCMIGRRHIVLITVFVVVAVCLLTLSEGKGRGGKSRSGRRYSRFRRYGYRSNFRFSRTRYVGGGRYDESNNFGFKSSMGSSLPPQYSRGTDLPRVGGKGLSVFEIVLIASGTILAIFIGIAAFFIISTACKKKNQTQSHPGTLGASSVTNATVPPSGPSTSIHYMPLHLRSSDRPDPTYSNQRNPTASAPPYSPCFDPCVPTSSNDNDSDPPYPPYFEPYVPTSSHDMNSDPPSYNELLHMPGGFIKPPNIKVKSSYRYNPLPPS